MAQYFDKGNIDKFNKLYLSDFAPEIIECKDDTILQITLSIFQAKNSIKLIADDQIAGIHFCVKILQPL